MNIITYSIRTLFRGVVLYTFLRGIFAVGGDISAARKEKGQTKDKGQNRD